MWKVGLIREHFIPNSESSWVAADAYELKTLTLECAVRNSGNAQMVRIFQPIDHFTREKKEGAGAGEGCNP